MSHIFCFSLFNPDFPFSHQINKGTEYILGAGPLRTPMGNTKINTTQPLLIKKSQPSLEDRSFYYDRRRANSEYYHSASKTLWENREGALSPVLG